MVVHIDQKLKKQTGIICDLCGSVFVNKFEYYSAKFDLVEVDRAVGRTGIKKVDRQNLDLDICVGCMDKMKVTVISNIKKREDGGVWSVSVEPPKQDVKPKPATPRGVVAQKVTEPPKQEAAPPEPPAPKQPEALKELKFVTFDMVKETKETDSTPEKPTLSPVQVAPKIAPKPVLPKLTPRAGLSHPDLPPGPASPVIKKASDKKQEP